MCAGGDLSPARLVSAYSKGIFPWYSEGMPILWWSPNPRLILPLAHMHIPRSLPRDIRRAGFVCTINAAFDRVIEACAATPRPGQNGTWLLPEMIDAYKHLHHLGYAFSAESWCKGELVGGIYGINLGQAFFGESMFYARSDASKAALLHLAGFLRARGTILFDCQQTTAHMLRFGAVEVPRREFIHMLKLALKPRAKRRATAKRVRALYG